VSTFDNPLRELNANSGVGFCYELDRDLFVDDSRAHGPLLIALDSNLVIDLQTYGAALIDQVPREGVDESYGLELDALGRLVELWFLRDIRFVILPGAHSDDRRAPAEPTPKSIHRVKMLQAIELALTFQLDDWGFEGLRHPWELRKLTALEETLLGNIPHVLDRALVGQAVRCGADVFLTRDEKVLQKSLALPAGYPNVLKPSSLMEMVDTLGEHALFLGISEHGRCELSFDRPFSDSGKMAVLLEALDPYNVEVE